ncbi:MAG: DUF3566 domain-containing protein [Streptosporangiaceae bacterium]
MTARPDDDLLADDDQDTAADGIMTPTVRSPHGPAAAMPASGVKDATANGSSAADENGTGRSAGTGLDGETVPALPADTIGSARDSSPFMFSRPVSSPVAPADEDLTFDDPGQPMPEEAPATETFAAAEPDTAAPIGADLFSPAMTAAEEYSPAPASAEPEQPSVTAAAFTWAAADPAPTSPSSPARNFLRSNSNAKTSSAKTAPAAAVGPAKASPGAGRKGSKRSARQAHLTIARVEPWSVMKFSFVVSLVAFVILFVAVSVLYGALSALGVFESLQRVVASVTSSQDSAGVNAAKWFTASRVLGYTALLGSLNIVLITAMSTIGAVIYNLTSRLIGGVEVTLRETE